MNPLYEFMVRHLENGNLLFAIPAILLAGIFYAGRHLAEVVEFLDKRREKQIETIHTSLQFGQISDTVREFLVERLDRRFFKESTGISAGPHLREKIKEILQVSGGELDIKTLAESAKHLTIKSGRLSITITPFHWAEYFYNGLVAIFSALFATLSVLYGISAEGLTPLMRTAAIVGGLVAIVFSVFMISEAMAFFATRRLKRIIENLQNA